MQNKFYLILMPALLMLAQQGMSQNKLTTEGGQHVIVYDGGYYCILTGENGQIIPMTQIKSLERSNNLLSKANFIEADYFVTIHHLQKESDILNIKLKQAIKEGNELHEEDCKLKIKELKSKIKDFEGLYDNALYFQKQATRYTLNPQKFPDKKLVRLENYVQSKEYMVKTTKYKEMNETNFIVEAYIPPTVELIEESVSSANDNLVKNQAPKSLNKNDCSLSIYHENNEKVTQHDWTSVFTYTPDRLKVHLKQENLMECLARIKKQDKIYILEGQFILRSKDAAKSYGHIPEGNIIRVEFVNGIRLNFKVKENVFGRIEEYSGKVQYRVIFELDKEMMKMLKNLPVDVMGVMWSSGFEKYEVFEVDVLMRQINCLEEIDSI